jgi:S1-C subfamily serine protease
LIPGTPPAPAKAAAAAGASSAARRDERPIAEDPAGNSHWVPWAVAAAVGCVVLALACLAIPWTEDAPRIPANSQELIGLVQPSVIEIVVPNKLGSGFILDQQATVATSYHVVENAPLAKVRLASGQIVDVRGFVAADRGKDLVLLQLEDTDQAVAPLPLALTLPKVGESVWTVGSPHGFSGTVSNGIVSAIRTGQELKDHRGGEMKVEGRALDLDATWVQTTAPISQGNSGGPLVNLRGEVVGVNAWQDKEGQNLNFAISAQHLQALSKTRSAEPRPLQELP